mgnify:CR=1 FL=1
MKKSTLTVLLVILLIILVSGSYWFLNKEKIGGWNSDSLVTISPESLNPARTNMYYLQTLHTTRFLTTEDINWKVASGTLPSGLVLERDTRGCMVPENCPAVDSTDGLLSGTITAKPGSYKFTISVDNGTKTGTIDYELIIN